MPLETLDRSPPPIFKQGPSALSKFIVFSALAFFLMVVDVRFRLVEPVRAVFSTALYSLQWFALQPVRAVESGRDYLVSLNQVLANNEMAQKKLATQAMRALQVESLNQENARLRKLLELRQRMAPSLVAAEVLYDAADIYTRKVIIDKGLLQGIELGSPVVDETGVLGQVTRVYPLLSEVTLVIDRDLTIPVLNVRTGARSVAYGDTNVHANGLELRFMGSNSDVQKGDLLTTSGIDGVYPAGLPVATIDRIERRAESAFARIYCLPQASVLGARYVMVIKPESALIPPRPSEPTHGLVVKKAPIQ